MIALIVNILIIVIGIFSIVFFLKGEGKTELLTWLIIYLFVGLAVMNSTVASCFYYEDSKVVNTKREELHLSDGQEIVDIKLINGKTYYTVPIKEEGGGYSSKIYPIDQLKRSSFIADSKDPYLEIITYKKMLTIDPPWRYFTILGGRSFREQKFIFHLPPQFPNI